MRALRNTFRQARETPTVPEMLARYRAVKPNASELRRNSGGKTLFEAAVFQDLALAALVESQKLVAQRGTRRRPL